MRKPLRSEVEIEATPEEVWKTFTDFRTFPSWNPFIRKAKGKLVPGKRIKIKLRLGRRNIRFKPRLMVVDEPHELRWLASQRIPGLFDVDRRFRIEPVGESSSRFVQSETGRGLLAPVMMPLMGRRILKGYQAFNAALKERIELPKRVPLAGSAKRGRRVASTAKSSDSKGSRSRSHQSGARRRRRTRCAE